MSKAFGRTIQDARKTCIETEDKIAYALSEDGQNEAKAFLSGYLDYDKLILDKMGMLEEMREKCDNISQFLGNIHSNEIADKTAEIAASIADLESEITQDIDGMFMCRCEIQRLINCIQEKKQRAMLEMRFIRNMPIFKIAMALHYDERTIYRIQKQALARIAVMLIEDTAKYQ